MLFEPERAAAMATRCARRCAPRSPGKSDVATARDVRAVPPMWLDQDLEWKDLADPVRGRSICGREGETRAPARSMTRGFVLRVGAKALVPLRRLRPPAGGDRPAPGDSESLSDLPPSRAAARPMDIMRDYPSSVMWRLDPLLDAHQIGRPKSADEFRVAVLGDSGHPFDLLSRPRAARFRGACRLSGHSIRGRRVRAYNLRLPDAQPAPGPSSSRNTPRGRQPDAIVWFVTLYDLASDALSAVSGERAISCCRSTATTSRRWRTGSRSRRGRRGSSSPRRIASGRSRSSSRASATATSSLLLARGALDAITPGIRATSFRPRRPWIGSFPLPAQPLFEARRRRRSGDAQRPVGPASRPASRSPPRGVPILVVNDPIFRATGPGADREYNPFYGRRIYDRYRSTPRPVLRRARNRPPRSLGFSAAGGVRRHPAALPSGGQRPHRACRERDARADRPMTPSVFTVDLSGRSAPGHGRGRAGSASAAKFAAGGLPGAYICSPPPARGAPRLSRARVARGPGLAFRADVS